MNAFQLINRMNHLEELSTHIRWTYDDLRIMENYNLEIDSFLKKGLQNAKIQIEKEIANIKKILENTEIDLKR